MLCSLLLYSGCANGEEDPSCQSSFSTSSHSRENTMLFMLRGIGGGEYELMAYYGMFPAPARLDRPSHHSTTQEQLAHVCGGSSANCLQSINTPTTPVRQWQHSSRAVFAYPCLLTHLSPNSLITLDHWLSPVLPLTCCPATCLPCLPPATIAPIINLPPSTNAQSVSGDGIRSD